MKIGSKVEVVNVPPNKGETNNPMNGLRGVVGGHTATHWIVTLETPMKTTGVKSVVVKPSNLLEVP